MFQCKAKLISSFSAFLWSTPCPDFALTSNKVIPQLFHHIMSMSLNMVFYMVVIRWNIILHEFLQTFHSSLFVCQSRHITTTCHYLYITTDVTTHTSYQYVFKHGFLQMLQTYLVQLIPMYFWFTLYYITDVRIVIFVVDVPQKVSSYMLLGALVQKLRLRST